MNSLRLMFSKLKLNRCRFNNFQKEKIFQPAGAKPPPPIPKKPFSNTQQKYLNASSLKDSG